jgi:hypothetical protein
MFVLVRKGDAHRLVDQLRADATWDALMQKTYVQEAFERGLEDSRSDKVTAAAEVRRKCGLPE